MCVVIDLDVVCLICLQPNKEMNSVFANDVDSPELQIAQKISILSELKIDPNNHTLPSKICAKCLQDLKAAWRFRKNCQAAVTIFQTIVSLNADQEEDEDDTSKEGTDKHIKVLKSLPKEEATESDAEHSANMLTLKKGSLKEYVIVNDKSASTHYEEFSPNEYVRGQDETEEFQSLEGVGENEDEAENTDGDGNAFVEYYISEEGIAEQYSIKVETGSSGSNTTKTTKNKKLHEEKDAKQQKLTTLLTKMHKPIRRGRPRKQQTEEEPSKQTVSPVPPQNSKKVCKLKKSEDVERSENKTKTINQVRQVQSRKRISLSPGQKPPKICEICGNSYRFQHALNAHMRRHYNERPFSCEFCDKAFVSNVELRRHLRVHTGQKPYGCQYCDRRFSDFGSRIKHERTHTGERPYVCGTCGKSFAYPHVLSVHLHTHTGQKRFRCDYCSKGFTKKAYLQSHLEQHHIGPNKYENNDEATNSSQEKCNLNMEYLNEEAIDDNDEYEDEEDEETDQIIPSKAQHKDNNSNDEEYHHENDDNEEGIHEIVEVLTDEYTIRVR